MPKKRKRFVMDSDETASDDAKDETASAEVTAKVVAEVVEEEDEESWQFDCVCGVKGTNVDDGTEMVQCGKADCGLWFHSACVSIEDETGRLHLPRVCWKCQGIKLEDSELASRINYLEYEYTVTTTGPGPESPRLPRAAKAPVALEHNALCQACGMGGELLCCDFCNLVYHLGCLDPPMEVIPDGKWECPECQAI